MSKDQNDRVRDAVRELLRRNGDNQSLLAPQLGFTQSALSGFLSGRQGTSYATARRAAKLLGADVERLIEGTASLSEGDRYPNRAKAALFAQGEIRQDAIDYVLSMDLKRDGDLPATKWLEMMRYWAEQLEQGIKP